MFRRDTPIAGNINGTNGLCAMFLDQFCALNQRVVGSIPTSPTKPFNGLAGSVEA
jgi:hypothetical protein